MSMWDKVKGKGLQAWDEFSASASQKAGAYVGHGTGVALGNMLGIPSAGQMQARYNKEAFPGTTPWEQLGSPGAGVGGALANQRNQFALTRMQVKGQQKVAKIQACLLYTSPSPRD